MSGWLGAALSLMTVLALSLAGKLFVLRRDMARLADALGARLATDTNALLTLPCRDRALRRLASRLNDELQSLIRARHRYQQGDAELKAAIAGISHDLRTPLTAILGYLDLTEREAKSENAARYLAVVRERANAMARLTEDLFSYTLAAAGQEGTARQDTNLNAALEESLAAAYTVLTEKGIAPRVRMPGCPVVRRLDPAALNRVLGNLLSNAARYSGGDLEIALTEAGEITFSNAAPHLTPVQAARLFDRFYTVSSAPSAAGLGLSIARLLTERMGGTINAEYRDGRLTVRLRF